VHLVGFVVAVYHDAQSSECQNVFVLSKFRSDLLAADHLMTWEKTKFDIEQKCSKFLLDIMTLVSSANCAGCDTVFVVRGSHNLCILRTKGALQLARFLVHVPLCF